MTPSFERFVWESRPQLRVDAFQLRTRAE